MKIEDYDKGHYFNSIKVRLNQAAYKGEYDVRIFQFHKGTIKTRFPSSSISKLPLFQFHKGTIKTGGRLCRHRTNNLFQFHKGTIKTNKGQEQTDQNH